MTRTLRAALDSTGSTALAVPGATDPFMAKLIEEAGFSAVYITGAGTAATMYGLPDVGLVTMTEMLANAQRIASSVAIPVIADADTGYGNAVNVVRTVQMYEAAGVSAIQLEDQEFPKKCGHMAGKRIVTKSEMCGKIRAAIDARSSSDTLVIARTDALAVSNMDEVLTRAAAYVKAGADILFPEAMTTPEEFRRFASEFSEVPLVANMTEWGKSPLLTLDELSDMGYSIVLFPSAAMRAAQFAIVELLADLAATGTQKHWLTRMYPREDLYRLLGLNRIYEQEKRYGVFGDR